MRPERFELARDTDIVRYLDGLSAERRAVAVEQLGEAERAALDHDWRSWAHDGQAVAEAGAGSAGDAGSGRAADAAVSDWQTWVIMAGRGFGKTRAGAEWVLGAVRGPSASGESLRIALVAATADEARRVMVEGERAARRRRAVDRELEPVPAAAAVRQRGGGVPLFGRFAGGPARAAASSRLVRRARQMEEAGRHLEHAPARASAGRAAAGFGHHHAAGGAGADPDHGASRDPGVARADPGQSAPARFVRRGGACRLCRDEACPAGARGRAVARRGGGALDGGADRAVPGGAG